MLRMTALLPILLLATPRLANGMGDYCLDIGDGYEVIRFNSVQIGLHNKDASVYIGPASYDISPGEGHSVGPLWRYCVTHSHIYTWHHGRINRNLFDGDTFVDVDKKQEYFFILEKEDSAILGPLNRQTFESQLGGDRTITALEWQTARHPQFWRLAIYWLGFLFIMTTLPTTMLILLLLAAAWWITSVRNKLRARRTAPL